MTEKYELAFDIMRLYESVEPTSRTLGYDITQNVYESIIGTARYPFENFARDLFYWLEGHVPDGQRGDFEGVRDRLAGLGIIPGPR